MLRKTQTDRTANNFEQISSSDQQELHLSDSTGEVLQWRRATLDNPVMQGLEELTGMLSHAVMKYGKNVEKQIKHLRKF